MTATRKLTVPTVLSPKTVGGQVVRVPVVRERRAFTRIQPPAHLDEATRHWMTRVQDSVEQSTEGARHDPTIDNKVIIPQITATWATAAAAGSLSSPIIERHGLGVAFTGYRITRYYAPTAAPFPFQLVEVMGNGGKDPTLYIVLQAQLGLAAGGGVTPKMTFDLEVWGG